MAKSAKKAIPKHKPQAQPTPQPGPDNTIDTNITTMNNMPTLTATSLVAESAPHSQQVSITFTFTGGIGQATSLLFRKGVLINMQSISSSGNIRFSEVQSGDSISVNGVCTGSALIVIDTPTIPTTPEQFTAGIIITGYLIQ
ncbi:MAG: hypothetical protein ACJ751_09320 [Niastella sp.]|jgi:hypothetical protein|uniref:hypothetical protein n=1 Tax=Niastella sp. TaxID=1869183 RepID=UPI00389A29D4